MAAGYSPTIPLSPSAGDKKVLFAKRALQDNPNITLTVPNAEKIAKPGRDYGNDTKKLYEEAAKFAARGTKANLERAARRLERIIELTPDDTVKKLELAEVCMIIAKPETLKRAAQLYEEVRISEPTSVLITGKEVKALRKAGYYDAAIELGTAAKAVCDSQNDRNWLDIQIRRAEDLKPK